MSEKKARTFPDFLTDYFGEMPTTEEIQYSYKLAEFLVANIVFDKIEVKNGEGYDPFKQGWNYYRSEQKSVLKYLGLRSALIPGLCCKPKRHIKSRKAK